MLIYANIQTSGDSLSYLLLLNTLNQNIKVANIGCIMLWQSIYMHKRTVLPCVAVGEVVCRGVVVVWRVHVVLCFIAFCAVSCLALFSVISFAHYPNTCPGKRRVRPLHSAGKGEEAEVGQVLMEGGIGGKVTEGGSMLVERKEYIGPTVRY